MLNYKNTLRNYFMHIDSILFHFPLFVSKKVGTQRTILQFIPVILQWHNLPQRCHTTLLDQILAYLLLLQD